MSRVQEGEAEREETETSKKRERSRALISLKYYKLTKGWAIDNDVMGIDRQVIIIG